MRNIFFNLKLLLAIFILSFNLFSNSILDQIFEKKLEFKDKAYSPKELFESLSHQLGIKFIYKGENNYTISVSELKGLPAKNFFILGDRTFDFHLKFDENGRLYIIVKESMFFKGNFKEVEKNGEIIGIDMYDTSIKDILKELEKVFDKKFLIENDKILERKTSLKISNVEFEELLKKLSKEIGFNYKIEDNKVRIW